jgi:zinc transport system substrate-binding protein
MKKKTFLPMIILCIATLIVTSCQKEQGRTVEPKKFTIVATLFPLYDFARHIAGDRARVVLLLPPGVETHSFEPKPGDMMKVNTANLFIYTGKYMEPWAGDILKSVDNKNLLVIDASMGIALKEGQEDHDHQAVAGKPEEGHKDSHGKYDPHIWLDFSNAQKMVDNILEGLVRQDPANKEFYTKNAAEYKTELQKLDGRFKNVLSGCEKNTFIHGGHFAFNYLASRYNLHYISAYEGSPNAEPTLKKIIALKKEIQKRNIRYVYYEELITPRIAEVLALETGARLLKLNGAHNISKDELEQGKTFVQLMEENLINLKVGLQCR